ncbi:hypothetical protein HYV10_03300 [Candidatus Dependentiae bacterium]|nr:hypothetical protein [Candidatus Dependentiae bacterium]
MKKEENRMKLILISYMSIIFVHNLYTSADHLKLDIIQKRDATVNFNISQSARQIDNQINQKAKKAEVADSVDLKKEKNNEQPQQDQNSTRRNIRENEEAIIRTRRTNWLEQKNGSNKKS